MKLGKYRVVIRAFTKNRDVSSAILVKKLLEDQGCDVFIASSRNYYALVRRWRPHAVLVNTQSVVKATRAMLPDAIIALWHGEGGEVFEGSEAFHIKSDEELYPLIDLIFTWGEAGESFFQRLFGDDEMTKRFVAGNPRLEVAKFYPELLEHRPKSNTIGILGHYLALNNCEGYPPIRTLHSPSGKEELIQEMGAYLVTLQAIEKILDRTSFDVSIRPHPGEAPQGYRYIKRQFGPRVSLDEGYDFGYWAAHQRAIVAPSSSAFLEAYVLRIPVVNVERIAGTEHIVEEIHEGRARYFLDQQRASLMPKTVDELVDTLCSTLEPPARNESVDERLRETHNWYAGTSGARTVSERLLDAIVARRPGPVLHMPRLAANLEDALRFRIGRFRSPLIVNFNYQQGYHETPKYFDDVVSNIQAGTRVPADLGAQAAMSKAAGAE